MGVRRIKEMPVALPLDMSNRPLDVRMQGSGERFSLKT